MDAENKKTLIPLPDHAKIASLLRQAGITVNPIPKNILAVFLKLHEDKKQKSHENVDLTGISAKLLQSLYAFQRRGVVFALRKNGRILLG